LRQLLFRRADFHLVPHTGFHLVPHGDFHSVPRGDFHSVPRGDFHPDLGFAKFLGFASAPATSTADRIVRSTPAETLTSVSHIQMLFNEAIQRTYALDGLSKHTRVKRSLGAPPICHI
jgi:hypothetical protein